MVIAISTSLAVRNGILVRDRLALEEARTVDLVILDTTGTLTKGAHTVTAIAATGVRTEDDVLRLAAAVESDSEHPLAKAIVKAAAERAAPTTATGFRSLTGRGVQAVVDGTTYAVGGPALLRELDVTVPADLGARSFVYGTVGEDVSLAELDGMVTLNSIAPDSVQSRAGLHDGDRILSMNGVELRSLDDLGAAVDASVGGRLDLVVDQGGEPAAKSIDLGKAVAASDPTGFLGVGQESVPQRLGPIAAAKESAVSFGVRPHFTSSPTSFRASVRSLVRVLSWPKPASAYGMPRRSLRFGRSRPTSSPAIETR